MQRLKLYLRNEDKNGYMTLHPSDLNAEIENLQDNIIELQIKLKNQQNKLRSVIEHNEELNSKLIHNLINPLGSVYSFAEMILESHQKYSPEKLLAQLKILQSAAAISISLINSYADYMNSLNVAATWTGESFDLRALIREIVSRSNPNNRIIYKKEKKATSLMVFANQSDIRRVIETLLDNAQRFSLPDTKIRIKMDELEEKIKIAIEDNGIGIENDHLKNICQPFFTVATYDCNQKKCTGLGLALAKNLMNRNDGVLEFESILNQGTVAKIYLKKM